MHGEDSKEDKLQQIMEIKYSWKLKSWEIRLSEIAVRVTHVGSSVKIKMYFYDGEIWVVCSQCILSRMVPMVIDVEIQK